MTAAGVDIEQESTYVNLVAGAPSRNYGRFYRKWITNKYRTKQEGREIGEYKDYVMIISPGQTKSEVHRVATDEDKAEFPKEWALYSQGKEQMSSGTPIELLPGMDAGRAAGFKVLYINTIEQLAELSDAGLQTAGMGSHEWRKRAQDYLRTRNVVADELAAEKKRVADLEAKIAKMSEAMKRMEARLAAKPARKRKAKDDG